MFGMRRIYWAVFAWIGTEQVTLATHLTRSDAEHMCREARTSGEYDEVDFVDMD